MKLDGVDGVGLEDAALITVFDLYHGLLADHPWLESADFRRRFMSRLCDEFRGLIESTRGRGVVEMYEAKTDTDILANAVDFRVLIRRRGNANALYRLGSISLDLGRSA